MSAGPRLSIVLPFRDAATTLATALDSLAAQTLTDWECLLVDDGSSDGSLDIARARAAGDTRWRLLPGRRRTGRRAQSRPRRGARAARRPHGRRRPGAA